MNSPFRRIFICIAAFGFLGFTFGSAKTLDQGTESFTNVSLIQIIINPETYLGKKVQVAGYLADKVNYYLFLTSEHSAASDFSSAIFVSETDNGQIATTSCWGSFVFVRGTLAKDIDGELGITNVQQVFDVSEGKTCW